MKSFNSSENEVILVNQEAYLDGEWSRGRGPGLGLIITTFECFLRWEEGVATPLV